LKFAYNLRFPGQYYDAETGLNQNWNRDYDPLVGRYVESDPLLQLSASYFTRPGTLTKLLLRNPQLLGSYTYVGDGPISRRDPMGMLDVPAEIVQYFPPPVINWNGNLWPGFTEQDGVCTLPGCIGRTANANPPVLACCQTHDACYTQNRCNASSWILQGTFSQSCQQCNAAAMSCITNAVIPRPLPWIAHPEAMPFPTLPPVQ